MAKYYKVLEVNENEISKDFISKEDIRKNYGISAGLLVKVSGLQVHYIIIETRKFQKELYEKKEVEDAINKFVKLSGGVNVEHALFLRNRKQTRDYLTLQKLKKK